MRLYAKMDEMDNAVSFKKKIMAISSPAEGLTNVKRLTDGIFGLFESWRFPEQDLNWVAYKGAHMDFVLDLGEVMPVTSIANPAENPGIVKIQFQPFSAKINRRQARYIKVHAESPIQMPSWHINAGSPAIIYSDEIVVK
jgi:hypothetical protein